MIKPDDQFTSEVMPSYFCWNGNRAVVGEEARQMMSDERFQVIRCVKRFMKAGRNHLFESGRRHFNPVDVSSHYLKYLKSRAEQQLQLDSGALSGLVVTVPAYFGHDERMFTRQAAVDAGFASEQVHLLDEPIAAAYGLRLHQQPGAKLVMVVDLGGGTLDVTLLLVGASVAEEVEGPDGKKSIYQGMYELGREGDPKLGGDCWDRVIAKLLMFNKKLERNHEFLDYTNVFLYDACELAKRRFAESVITKQQVSFLDNVSKEIVSVDIGLEQYIRSSDYLVKRCGLICSRLFMSIPQEEVERVYRYRTSFLGRFWKSTPRELTWQDVDQICLVGGGSKLPQFKQCIADYWGKQPTVASYPQHQVAYGAGLIGYDVSRNSDFFERMLLRSPYSYGYYFYRNGPGSKPEFYPLIHRNQRVPVQVTHEVKVIGDPKAKAFKLEILEERDSFPEDFSNETEREYRLLGRIVISDLPNAASSKTEFATIVLQYYSDREMSIAAKFRGKDVKVDLNIGS
ncbi:Hsp70 family protein [Anatilimnocola floriformis]|uniref:Hsp70 family protein n=1 Tax=Anatilimnocola floriformis TaxID=2948575 RepID=UPI0036F27D8B